MDPLFVEDDDGRLWLFEVRNLVVRKLTLPEPEYLDEEVKDVDKLH